MNRYSGRNTLFEVYPFVFPVLPWCVVNALYAPQPYRPWPQEILLLWVCGVLLSFFMIIVHEAGHALAFWATGIPIYEVSIGQWRKIGVLTFGRIKVTFRWSPAAGYVTPHSNKNYFSVPRLTFALLAGVLAEAIIAVAVCSILPPEKLDSFSDFLWAYLVTFIIASAVLHAFWNLNPREYKFGTESVANDGLLLMRLWTKRQEHELGRNVYQDAQELQKMLTERRCQEAIQEVQQLIQKYPGQHHLRHLCATIHSELGETAKAEEIWRELIKLPRDASDTIIQALDGLCCLVLYRGRMDLLPEADGWVNQALKLSPQVITLQGTRGSLDIELGRVDDGLKNLTDMIKNTECDTDRVIASAYLAKACQLKGNSAAAKEWLDEAIRLNAEHIVVKRIKTELDRLSV